MDNPLTTTLSLHQAEAERLFAGAAMIDDEYAREACGWLSPDAFLDEKIRAFWAKVQAGTDAHEAAMQVGAYYEMAGYMTRVTSSRDLPAFANTIGMDRYLTESAVTLSGMARAIAQRDTDSLRNLAQSIAANTPVSADAVPNAAEIGLEFQVMLDNLSGRSELTGITTLDMATGGVEKQTLTVVAARPSMGKSALGIQIVKWKAEHEDKRVMLFSLEMNRKSIWARMACGELKLAWRDVRSGRATPEQIQALKNKSSNLMDRLDNRLLIDDTSDMSMEDIWRKVSRYQPDFVVIDHMGLVNSSETNEVLSLGQISRAGKILSKQFDIPVIALFQLNRGTEARDNKRPTMKDIRGSGKIEENADNIFFLYRPDYYDEAQANDQVISNTELIIAKFRDGIRNIKVDLEYNLSEQWFYPMASKDQQRQERRSPAQAPARAYRKPTATEPEWEGEREG
jgi:replicative DNA helicase